ncbi:MAG: TldD/PmbA family protein [Nitrososphaeria archaeon]
MRTEEIDLDLPSFVIEQAEKAGAEYAEARLHSTEHTICMLKNGQQEPIALGRSFGLGLRVIVNGGLAFSATNILQRDRSHDLVEQTVKKAKAMSKLLKDKIVFSRERKVKKRWRAEEKERLEDKNFEDGIKVLRELDSIVLERKDYIPMRFIEMELSTERKIIENSQGTRVEGYVPRLFVSGFLTGVKESRMAQKSIEYGGSGGWELLEILKIREQVEHQSQIIKNILDKAQKTIPGDYDIITGSEVTGIIAHESIGHPFEADRVLGREAAQAGESYLKPSDVGRRIGNEQANISDDPTIPYSYGFYLYDDEGIEARKRKLLANGVVNELLHNRATARAFKTKSNGAARSISFNREPIVRMANTFVEPGDYSLEELIREVKHGIFVNSFMEWNIDDIRQNQRYVGHESYLIEDGEVRNLIVNPIIEVTTERLWSSLDARGKQVEFWAAICGKGDPMQGVPVWAGGPNLRFKNMKVKTR